MHDRSRTRAFMAFALAALLASCGTQQLAVDDHPAASDKQGKHEAAQGADARKKAKRERAVEVARKHVAQAELTQKVAEQKQKDAVAAAEGALQLSHSALAQFDTADMALQVKSAELGLREKENDLRENQEELEQLKLMYAEQDLADKTREMVVARTERRLAQTEAELALKHQELELLKSSKLPTERLELTLAVQEKEQALAAARLDARLEWNSQQLALLEAQNTLIEAEEELLHGDEDEDENNADGEGEGDTKGDEGKGAGRKEMK